MPAFELGALLRPYDRERRCALQDRHELWALARPLMHRDKNGRLERRRQLTEQTWKCEYTARRRADHNQIATLLTVPRHNE